MPAYQKPYQLSSRGNLLWVNANIGGRGVRPLLVRLVVDTGSSYTILPLNVLERVGCDVDNPLRRQEIFTGQGRIYVPVVSVVWFNCVGQTLKNFEVAAHNIPVNLRVDGLLGMDFLKLCQAIISVREAEIRCQRQ